MTFTTTEDSRFMEMEIAILVIICVAIVGGVLLL